MKLIQRASASTMFVCLALAASASHAATWTYSSTGPVTNSGLTATASAFSATNNSTATITATTAYYSGGLGVRSSGEAAGSPQHAIDNNNGAIETVMISFSDGVAGLTTADKVNLSAVTFGWASGDSDFSVYAYTGASSSPSPLGVSYSNLTTNGWTLIGHYNGGSSGATYSLGTSVYSSNWLIGAYNGLGTRSAGNDYFKLASVTGTRCPNAGTLPQGCGSTPPGSVPEPATWLLVGAGLVGLTRVSRRRRPE